MVLLTVTPTALEALYSLLQIRFTRDRRLDTRWGAGVFKLPAQGRRFAEFADYAGRGKCAIDQYRTV